MNQEQVVTGSLPARPVFEPYESAVFSLVNWALFRLCPLCDTLFVKNRKQRFCVPKCAERWHDQKKIEKRKRACA